MTVVYSDQSACFGIQALLPVSDADPSQPTYNTATAKYWNAAGVEQSCELNGAQTFDFGLMGNGIPLCAAGASASAARLATITDSFGPVSSVSVIVNEESTETSISASAFGAIYSRPDVNKRPAPWNVDSEAFKRTATSYVHIYLAMAAGLPASGLTSGVAVSPSTNEAMATAVGSLGGTQAARLARIGFVSSEVADQFSGTVNALAFQQDLGLNGETQSCGFWPDSTANARDKINVRTGRYFLWSATHFFTRNDAGHTSLPAQNLVAWLRSASGHPTPVLGGTTVDAIPTNTNLLGAIVTAGNIPECAMQVVRTADLGPIASFQPEQPCGCYFEKKATGAAPATCVTCTGTGQGTCASATQACVSGYCETVGF